MRMHLCYLDSWSWPVFLPSDIHRKPLASITAVLLQFVTYILTSSYIMTPEPISTAYFWNPLYQSMYMPPVVANQQLGKNVTVVTNARNNWRIVGLVCLSF
jgi:hypothetical protein